MAYVEQTAAYTGYGPMFQDSLETAGGDHRHASFSHNPSLHLMRYGRSMQDYHNNMSHHQNGPPEAPGFYQHTDGYSPEVVVSPEMPTLNAQQWPLPSTRKQYNVPTSNADWAWDAPVPATSPLWRILPSQVDNNAVSFMPSTSHIGSQAMETTCGDGTFPEAMTAGDWTYPISPARTPSLLQQGMGSIQGSYDPVSGICPSSSPSPISRQSVSNQQQSGITATSAKQHSSAVSRVDSIVDLTEGHDFGDLITYPGSENIQFDKQQKLGELRPTGFIENGSVLSEENASEEGSPVYSFSSPSGSDYSATHRTNKNKRGHDSANGPEDLTLHSSIGVDSTGAGLEDSGDPTSSASVQGSTAARRGRKNPSTNDPSKPFVCTLCSCRFRRQEHLKRHYRSLHTREKPFKCTDCGKMFSRSDNLSQHQRMHTADTSSGTTKVIIVLAHPSDGQMPRLPPNLPPEYKVCTDPSQLGAMFFDVTSQLNGTGQSLAIGEGGADGGPWKKRRRNV